MPLDFTRAAKLPLVAIPEQLHQRTEPTIHGTIQFNHRAISRVNVARHSPYQ